MDDNLLKNSRQYIKRRRRRTLWKRSVMTMAAVVVFFTTYFLILPAITMESDTICGMAEHTHDEMCYELRAPAEGGEEIKTLTCTSKTLELHEHQSSCYDDEKNIICGYADYVVHVHDDGCYDTDNNLVCTIAEKKEHKHTDSCYETQTELVCTTSESQGHSHTEACYEKQKGSLTCLKTEGEEHTHTDECYQWTDTLVCRKKESSGHSHGDSCYKTENVLTCKELELHEHSNSCYENNQFVCGKLELVEHKHNDDCYKTEIAKEEVLVCEIEEHTHVEECYPAEDAEETGISLFALGDEDEVQVAAEGDAEAQAEDDPYDLGNYVTEVTVQHKAAGEATWNEVVDGNVQTDDSLRFRLEYEIPGGKLDAVNRTVTYQTPLTVTKADSGYVYNGTEQVGTYTITEDGLITITFYEKYATDNADGSAISGYISFESSVDSLDTDTKGDVTLPFKEEVTLHVTDKVNDDTEDLQVTKSASNVKETGGTVDYTITVTSEKGTGSTVKLSDVMTGINLDGDGDITVKDKNGNIINVTPNEDSNGNFTIELPQMGAGDSYTITYSAKLPNADTLNGTVTVNNKVDVESTDSEGGVLVDEDDVDTTFKRNIISKSGTLNGDTITWTIIVNRSEIDIGGWTLSDVMDGVAYEGPVTISPNPSGGTTLTTELPYTFPEGSKDTYTVTYTTTIDTSTIGSASYSNTGTVTPGDGDGISAGDSVTGSTYNPLTKEASGVIINGNGTGTAEYKWTVTIDASKAAIEPYTQTISGQSYNVWYYGDELWNEATHWMTGAQIKAMAANLTANLTANYSGRFEIIAYVWNGGNGGKYQTPTPLSQVSDTAKYGQFRILFYDTLPQGQKITFTYSSTGNVGDGTASKELTNWGTVNNKVSDQTSQTYRPVVTKVDKNGNGSTTEHNIADSKLTFKDGKYIGVLGWNVYVTLPETTYTSDVVITEKIPAGTELLDDASGQWSLSFNLSGFSNEDFNFKDGEASITKTVDGVSYTVTAKKVDGNYVITIPVAMANKFAGKTISMEVRVQIDENLTWDELKKSFTNTVTVTTGNVELGEASQTQIIRNPQISKGSGEVSDNIVPYTLTINPEGKDLVAGADTLTLTDVLSFTQTGNDTVNALLLMDTVKVYKIETDGTKTDITAQCPYTFTETETNGTKSKTIVMTIPDGTPLQIAYSYRISGAIGTEVTISNTASIEGLGGTMDEDDSSIKVKVEESNAGATLSGVKIIKVDENNYALRLTGATFVLQKWNGTEYVPLEPDVKYTTGESGTVTISDLESDVAYRLIEEKAPNGYELDSEPYEFYISGSGTLSAPTDFKGKALNEGDSIFITNSEMEYTLPETGGRGTNLFTIGGSMLMMGCLLSGYLMKRKRERRVK